MSNQVVEIQKVPTPDPLLQPLSAGRGKGGNDNNVLSKKLKSKNQAPPFVGTNTNLEKDFLRLTTYPRSEDVRPYDVLIKSLAHIKQKYIQDEDFDWVNNQLKSVRQDIVCQGIRCRFVLDVYETHARILLEHGDLNEFNQCQTMIRSLTEKGVGGNSNSVDSSSEASTMVFSNSMLSVDDDDDECLLKQSDESLREFRSYALLYALVRNSRVELKRELDRMKDLLMVEGHSSSHESCCEHALQVLKAVEECNYRTFFRLYGSAPHMSAYLMDFLVKRVRDQAYERITSAYRPHVSVEDIREWLYLDDMEEARRFLRQRNAVFIEVKGEAPFWVDCKASK